jgi:hypothetical protein
MPLQSRVLRFANAVNASNVRLPGEEGGNMTRVALIIASVLILSFVCAMLVVVAVGDTHRFIALISSSLLVPGAVFGAPAALRMRRLPRRGPS